MLPQAAERLPFHVRFVPWAALCGRTHLAKCQLSSCQGEEPFWPCQCDFGCLASAADRTPMLLYFEQNLHAKTGSGPRLASQTCDVCVMGKVPACAFSSALLGARAIALSQSLTAAGKSPASALSFPSAWQRGMVV